MRAGFFLCLLLLVPAACPAAPAAPECDALEQDFPEQVAGGGRYAWGLLWRVSKAGRAPSHVFGTIHVADEDISRVPDNVLLALKKSDSFVMEVVPDPGEIMSFASLMYFTDGRRLTDAVSAPFFEELVTLLTAYHLPEEAITLMKPWAAFLTLSYPPEFGQVQDLRLLQVARENGADITGLETLREQVDIFDKMALDKQLRLLRDTVCHYDTVEQDFEKMKAMYAARDLAGLYAYGNRYSRSDDEFYRELIDKLLIERNYTMTERMQPFLNRGGAFIAVGAMHLAGEDGILSLLAKNNFTITRIY